MPEPSRIIGQDSDNRWHYASATYTTTMHTRCNQWLRVVAFTTDQNEAVLFKDFCYTCWSLTCFFDLRAKRAL